MPQKFWGAKLRPNTKIKNNLKTVGAKQFFVWIFAKFYFKYQVNFSVCYIASPYTIYYTILLKCQKVKGFLDFQGELGVS